ITFFFQAEDGIRDFHVTGVQTCALPISIASALEIGRRRAAQEVPERKKMTCSKDVFEFLKPYLGDLQTEEFWAVLVNQNNRILRSEERRVGKECKIRLGQNKKIKSVNVL